MGWLRYGLLCALFTVVFVYFRAADESASRAREAERDRARFGQRMDEARLQMLQAQIEPHFLFNTLANVRRLYQTDAGAQRESMLDNLMRYLAVALPQMRAADSTLGREAALAESYLASSASGWAGGSPSRSIFRQPLRDSRAAANDAADAGRERDQAWHSRRFPRAAPSASVPRRRRQLQVQVADSGQGFTKSSGGGTGLANIRARLAAMYGAAAHLDSAINSPRGVTATIALPYAASAPTTSPP